MTLEVRDGEELAAGVQGKIECGAEFEFVTDELGRAVVPHLPGGECQVVVSRTDGSLLSTEVNIPVAGVLRVDL